MDYKTRPEVMGAESAGPRLTMALFLRELAGRFLSVEQGWLRTARELTVDPGGMIKHYVQGQRKIYAHPFAYLVAGTALGIVIQKVIGFREKMTALARADTFESPLQMEFFNRFTELLFQNTLYIHLGILVPLALLLYLFFRKSGYNLAENFVFALYSGGQLALLGIVLIPIYMVLAPVAAAKGILHIGVAAAYSAYAARGFFGGSDVKIVIKTCIAYVMAFFIFLFVMAGVTAAYVLVVMVPTSTGQEWDLVTATDYEAVLVVEKLLVESAGDVNMTRHRTALHAAAENGNLEIADLLIEHGANVNLQDVHGRIPMFVALVAKHPKVALRLAEAQPDTSICTNEGSTLLMAALETEDFVLIQWALDHGVDVNALRPAEDHATALMIAAGDGNPDMVKMLLDHGASPDEVNHNGDTALELAKDQDVKELLRNCATVK
ncbi:MAG: hypothetical protein DRH08_15700 [Deltaproteobacteria bacterium]|nr:MAG: hypothetical protein DRH08_15700 [Deltaproteobacteria bacterium]